MFLQDNEGMKKICQGWGMNYSEAFAGAQLMRPYNEKKLLTDKL